jgi:leucine efflux protein
MLGISDHWAFVATVLVFLMLPGPGTFALLTAGAKARMRGGYAALAGLMLGDWLLMLAALVGVAAVLAAHPLLFKSLQWLGVAYLVWVGVRLPRTSGDLDATRLPITVRTYEGLATLGAMGLTISCLTFACGSALIVGGNRTAPRLQAHRSVGRWPSRFAGVALIAFGARLATE